MKVIFLDIDGVIQSPRYCVAMGQTGWLSAFEPAAMAFLAQLIELSDAKIVISSTWRMGLSSRELKMYFRVAGYKKIALSFHKDWATKEFNNKPRGEEIKDWLDRNPEVDNYLILDDDADMLDEQKANFVQTSHEDGFLLSHFDRAKQILCSAKEEAAA